MMHTLLPLLCLFCHLATAISPRHHLKRSLSPFLRVRQSCLSGSKECGVGCILNSFTCCPDKQGGCPANEYCFVGDNGEYACCEDGEICSGDGGVRTTDTYFYTSTRTHATSTKNTNGGFDDNLSWRTYTVTYDDGNRRRLSYAIYNGNGVVTESDDLAWTTTVLTQSDGDVVSYTIASESPEPLPFTETYLDLTTTHDWAIYQGGYVTDSNSYEWITTTYTFSNGAVTTATVAEVPDSDATAAKPSRTKSITSDIFAGSDTPPATVTVAHSTSGRAPTMTVTQLIGVSQAGAGRGDANWLPWSFAGAGMIVITMLLL